jgi:hypothetical protein
VNTELTGHRKIKDKKARILPQFAFGPRYLNCLVVTGTMELEMTFHILGISSSQVAFIFFRGVGIPPTRSS